MRPIPLLLPALGLLAACSKSPRPVRLDFIASARFTTSARVVGPGDTLSTRLYASGSDSATAPLTRFTVKVTYDPPRNPRVYPVPPAVLQPVPPDPPLVYLDSVLSPQAAGQFVYQNGFGTRTTSGHETWEFTVTDGPNMSTRSFRLRIANTDSLADFHQYVLRVPTAPVQPPRPFVALLPGLALPASVLRAGPAGRQLIDMVWRPGATSLSVYKNPDNAARAELRSTALDSASFLALTTPGLISTAYDQSQPLTSGTTGLLTRRQVVAFRTVDRHRGVFYVRRIVNAPYPVLELQVRVLKTADP